MDILTNTKLQDLELVVSRRLSSGRFRHVQGVVQTTLELAGKYNINTQSAYLASLLHDIAKEIKPLELLKTARENNLRIDYIEEQIPYLLHAKVGAHIAQTEFNINDRHILEAIECHTCGKPQMSLLAEIVFIADAIEPNRPNTWAEPIREQLYTHNNKDKAILQILTQSINNLSQKQQIIHAQTIATYNYYLKLVNSHSQ